MKLKDIPVIPIGPGSQPEESDGQSAVPRGADHSALDQPEVPPTALDDPVARRRRPGVDAQDSHVRPLPRDDGLDPSGTSRHPEAAARRVLPGPLTS